ncbi:MAG: hypothetical protein JNM18_25275 [Planctomycetaceae bacterium]|nr:hypothetical protein [Planctomycetaceae bacterium]
MSVWLNYYAERMRLMRELGVMQLDEHGSWLDLPLADVLGAPVEDLFPLPPCVPDAWLRELNVDPQALPPGSELVPPAAKDGTLPAPQLERPAPLPGDAPPMGSEQHLKPPVVSPSAPPPSPPGAAPGPELTPPGGRLMSRGRLRGNAKRWVDMVRRKDSPRDLESSVY